MAQSWTAHSILVRIFTTVSCPKSPQRTMRGADKAIKGSTLAPRHRTMWPCDLERFPGKSHKFQDVPRCSKYGFACLIPVRKLGDNRCGGKPFLIRDLLICFHSQHVLSKQIAWHTHILHETSAVMPYHAGAIQGTRLKVSSSAPTSETIFPTFRICIPPVSGAATASRIMELCGGWEKPQCFFLPTQIRRRASENVWILLNSFIKSSQAYICHNWAHLCSPFLHLRSNLEGILEVGGGMLNPDRVWLKAGKNS